MNKNLIIGIIVLVLLGIGSYYYSISTKKVGEETQGMVKSLSAKYAGKKILYIDSYHEGYAWSDGITKGVRTTLERTGIDLRVHRMDTKNNPTEDFKKQAGVQAKAVIEEFEPDVVLLSDDNAVNYVLAEFYRNASLLFIYSGLNWDSSLYGLPYSNTAGMVEISLTNQLIDRLKQYAQGNRIGYLSADTETERKNLENYNKLLKLSFEKFYFVKTLAEWKDAFERLQSEVDMIIFENNAGISDWNDEEAEKFALENLKVPAGTLNDWIMKTVLIGYTKVPEEQGEYMAETALKIFDGTAVGNIPEVTNKKGDLMINLKIAKKLNLAIAPAMIRAAKNIFNE